MGYTHYFEHQKVTKKVWKLMLVDWQKLFEARPGDLQIGGYHLHDGEWELKEATTFKTLIDDDGFVNLNGYPEELSHENMVLNQEGSGGFTFCKTARKPYDLIVCACLIVYMHHSSETMELGSDGDIEDWEDALKFVSDAGFPEYTMKFKMEVGDRL